MLSLLNRELENRDRYAPVGYLNELKIWLPLELFCYSYAYSIHFPARFRGLKRSNWIVFFSAKNWLKRIVVAVGLLFGLLLLIFGLLVGWFLAAPYLVGSKGDIAQLYRTIDIGDRRAVVVDKIAQAIEDNRGQVLMLGEAGVSHIRVPVNGSSGRTIVSGIKGGYICQGVIYFDANDEVLSLGDIRCID